jgi:hypothetical protein
MVKDFLWWSSRQLTFLSLAGHGPATSGKIAESPAWCLAGAQHESFGDIHKYI